MDEGTILVYFCPSTFSLTSLTPPPLPKVNIQNIQTVCAVGGGGVFSFFVENIQTDFKKMFM
jgi:hypothetical protein